jgi:hypothetical protein
MFNNPENIHHTEIQSSLCINISDPHSIIVEAFLKSQ